jgi:hypothetical protein
MTHLRPFIILTILIALALQPKLSAVQAQTPSPAFQPESLAGPLPLSAYPRPKNDNGFGIHWSTNLYGQSDKTTDFFVAELKAMNIKWVKILNEHTDGRHYDYLVEQLVANDIMPILRIYVRCNEAINLGGLGKMVQHYMAQGVYYYELYNEPDLYGLPGGWCKDPEPDPERLAELWAPAAREVQMWGAYPSLPSIFPVGKGHPDWQDSFFQRFLGAIKTNGDTRLLYRSWGAVHNYFLNHPPDYPMDEVSRTGRLLTLEEISKYKLNENQVLAINQARTERQQQGPHLGTDPRQDIHGFLQFIAYHDQFTEIFGFEIPLISTEGGATIGSCEDGRYPCVDEQIQMEQTLWAYDYMLDQAPDYYFAMNTWLLAQQALDFGGGYIWEGNAWYHDREGNHLPIVEALKTHPRQGEVRSESRAAAEQGSRGAEEPGSTLQPTSPTPQALSSAQDRPANPPTLQPANPPISHSSNPPAFQPSSLPAPYPRPANDNGRGVHYAPTILAQPPEMVDFFVAELLALNMKWVKIMQGDIPKIEHQYLIEQLVAHGIEPVLRVYKPYNDPYEHLPALVQAGLPLGVHYYELYNEPNIAGFPGGWHDGQAISVEHMLDVWLPAAEAIQQAGGYPGLPSLAAGGDYDDMKFLANFLDGLQARGRTDLLQRAWIPLHNYFFNHPFDYPEEPVNLTGAFLTEAEGEQRGLAGAQVQAINVARANARQPGGYYVGDTIHADSNSFRKFEAYAKIFFDRFGYHLPIITTEGGPLTGDHQDPRYPPVTDLDVTHLTLRAYHALLDGAPDYYFAYMPWLMANFAGGHRDNAWEAAAWYKLDGATLPVVQALKTDPRRQELRQPTMNNEQLVMNNEQLAIPNSQFPIPPPLHPSTPPPLQSSALPPLQPSIQVIPLTGSGPAWQVAQADWQPATSTYPRLRVQVLDAGGRALAGQQLRVEWPGGWQLLLTASDHSVTMPLTNPADTYRITIAGSSGQGLEATGAPGLDLNTTFVKAGES